MGSGGHRRWVLVEDLGEGPAGRMEAVTPLTREEGACRIRGPVPGVHRVHAQAEPAMRLLFQASCLLWQCWAGWGLQPMLGALR